VGARKPHGCREIPARPLHGSCRPPRSTLGCGLAPAQGPSRGGCGCPPAPAPAPLASAGVAEPQRPSPSHPTQQLGVGSDPRTPRAPCPGAAPIRRDSGPGPWGAGRRLSRDVGRENTSPVVSKASAGGRPALRASVPFSTSLKLP